ncbi:MAG TPA: hypothetical protein OIM16_07135 [Oscillospiraceae bacterium]|nr:hypothetical protein [Oscillospiraceae bacterium]
MQTSMGCKNSPAKTKRHITENSDGYVPFCGLFILIVAELFLNPKPIWVLFFNKKASAYLKYTAK